MITTAAILIRRIPLSETSLIVTWCSADHGVIKTVAKGARRPRSPFAGLLDLFVTSEIRLTLRSPSDLHLLCDVEVETFRFGLGEAYHRVLAASYFIQLIELVVERATPIPDQFALLTRALDYLETHNPDERAILHFERELARSLGIHLDTDGPAIQAIQRAYQAIPPQRQKLLEALRG